VDDPIGTPVHDAASTSDGSGYLSSHLRSTRTGLGYDRLGYATKSWNTFGSSVPTRRDISILDIGPGECELAELLVTAHQYERVSVIDMSSEVIDVARDLGIPAVLVDDAEQYLNEHLGTYDVIFLLHVLEHVKKDSVIPLLSAIQGALRPGGRLLLEVPNMGDPFNGLHARYADFTHEVGFTQESLNYVLTQAGFAQVTMLAQVGASGRITRPMQTLARKLLHGLLFVANLPNGRQMRRPIGPVLSVRADV
jgi:2-polyprenyl-3-methyl-5-hydroxy-6-metoxy-1,4-benzoquinol methylase